MSVPFDYENHEPPEELHPELRLGSDFVTQIQLDCDTGAIDLAKDIQKNKLGTLITQEAVYDKRFCALATDIGRTAFTDPVSKKLTPEAQAVKYGIIVGRIFGRLLCSGKILAQTQLESIEHVNVLFGPSSDRYDYEYWIHPRPGSMHEDASTLLRKRGIALARHTSDQRLESLFYDSAGYFAANGIARHIANKSKVRTLAESSAMHLQLKKWTNITKPD